MLRFDTQDYKETKNWSTAAGMLHTNAKTKRLEFSLPELQASRTINKSFHIVDIDLKSKLRHAHWS
jgi:hypothetical protein